MAHMNFVPDAHPENTSVDGHVTHEASLGGDYWTTLRAAAGTGSVDETAEIALIYMECGSDTGKFHQLLRSIFLFDTSAIPAGATITAAYFWIYGTGKYDRLDEYYKAQDPPSYYCGWKPQIGVYSANPASDDELVSSDYATLGTTYLCENFIGYFSWNTNGYNIFTLNADGLAAINKGGITKLGLRESWYDLWNFIPEWLETYGLDAWWFNGYCAEKGNGYEPKLSVYYTLASLPAVSTNPATSVDEDSAILNGYLDDDGGEACTCGFDYGTTIAYGTSVDAAGTYNTGESFLKAITGLLPGTLYHFRAKATNSVGTGYGADLTFTTLGSSYPTETITRVSGLVHRWSPGNFTLEIALGGLSAAFAIPQTTERPLPAIPEKVPSCPPGELLAWSSAKGFYCVKPEDIEVEP